MPRARTDDRSTDPAAPRRREIDRIVDQLERAFEGDAWHGSSVSEILGDVSAAEAARRPIEGAHTIWEIVEHTAAWQRTVRERLEGKPLRALPEEQDWPRPREISEEAWGASLERLRQEYERLCETARRFQDRELDERTEGGRYTVYEMLHGVLQHDLYHAGQIALLKKGAREAASSRAGSGGSAPSGVES